MFDIIYNGIMQYSYFKLLKTHFVFSQPRFLNYTEDLENSKKLDAGNFGEIFKAKLKVKRPDKFDKVLFVDVVCKVPKADSGESDWHELQTLQNLPFHQHVVGLLALCTGFPDQTNTSIKRTATIIPFKRGGSLYSHLLKRKSSLLLKRFLEFAIDATEAVHHMHTNKYKHLDIAARNFLLEELEQDDGRQSPEKELMEEKEYKDAGLNEDVDLKIFSPSTS
eukprot:TRINITY_DN3974_c0_g1_i1.p1 TRINITY_DN3974_c0_g1~~TRINITY_DN3974_c0_g1_i1.p1  ORF type:complete len:222 (-),score=39.36 TRINITY_DN3974_c0_g1_i1:156-821(-)